MMTSFLGHNQLQHCFVLKALFKNPKFTGTLVSTDFATNQTWYVTFATEDDALKAYNFLRDEVKVFKVIFLRKSIRALRLMIFPISRISPSWLG